MKIAHNVDYEKTSNILNDKRLGEKIACWVRLLGKGIVLEIRFRIILPKEGFEDIVIRKDSDLCKGVCFQENVFKKNVVSNCFDISKDVFQSWLTNKFFKCLPVGSKICTMQINFDGSDIEWIGN